ncbi:MAG: winged helix-turn-helix transcriptional regulator [Burkholderiaceae bacterium]
MKIDSFQAKAHPIGAQRPSVEEVAHRIRTSVVHDVLRIIADPWNPHILLVIWLGCDRFQRIVDILRISRSTLTQRMALLQQEGCVLKDAADGGHARYRLSDKGADLLGTVALNRQWNSRWEVSNRVLPDFRFAHDCGAMLEARVACGSCGIEAHARDLKVLPTSAPQRGGDIPEPAYRRARRLGARADLRSTEILHGEDLSGDRWTALILAVAFMGLHRNSEIEQAIGIASNVLASRLALLTENRIFRRVRYQANPERFEYQLTQKGLDRHAVMLAMVAWASCWLAPSPGTDWNILHKPCHAWLQPRLVCAACGGEVRGSTLRPGGRSPARL